MARICDRCFREMTNRPDDRDAELTSLRAENEALRADVVFAASPGVSTFKYQFDTWHYGERTEFPHDGTDDGRLRAVREARLRAVREARER